MSKSFSMIRKARGTLAEEKQPIQEAKDKPYHLVVFYHTGEDVRDIADGGAGGSESSELIQKATSKLGIKLSSVDFVGAYLSEKNGKTYIHSFPFNDEGKVIYPNSKERSSKDFQKPIEINPDNTILMPRGLGTIGLTGNRNWVDMIRKLKEDGFYVLNSLENWDLCSSKYICDILFRNAGLMTPKTVPVAHSEDTERAYNELGTPFPVILKASTGTQTGVGVVKVDSLSSLNSMIQMMFLYDKLTPIIIQQFIKTDYDVRAVVLNGRIIGSMKRKVIEGADFRSNVSLGADSEAFELTDLEEDNCIKAADAVKGMICGVDFIPSKNREKEQPFMLEVNSNPGFGGVEKINPNKSLTEEIFREFMNRDNWIDKSKNT